MFPPHPSGLGCNIVTCTQALTIGGNFCVPSLRFNNAFGQLPMHRSLAKAYRGNINGFVIRDRLHPLHTAVAFSKSSDVAAWCDRSRSSGNNGCGMEDATSSALAMSDLAKWRHPCFSNRKLALIWRVQVDTRVMWQAYLDIFKADVFLHLSTNISVDGRNPAPLVGSFRWFTRCF